MTPVDDVGKATQEREKAEKDAREARIGAAAEAAREQNESEIGPYKDPFAEPDTIKALAEADKRRAKEG